MKMLLLSDFFRFSGFQGYPRKKISLSSRVIQIQIFLIGGLFFIYFTKSGLYRLYFYGQILQKLAINKAKFRLFQLLQYVRVRTRIVFTKFGFVSVFSRRDFYSPRFAFERMIYFGVCLVFFGVLTRRGRCELACFIFFLISGPGRSYPHLFFLLNRYLVQIGVSQVPIYFFCLPVLGKLQVGCPVRFLQTEKEANQVEKNSTKIEFTKQSCFAQVQRCPQKAFLTFYRGDRGTPKERIYKYLFNYILIWGTYSKVGQVAVFLLAW